MFWNKQSIWKLLIMWSGTSLYPPDNSNLTKCLGSMDSFDLMQYHKEGITNCKLRLDYFPELLWKILVASLSTSHSGVEADTAIYESQSFNHKEGGDFYIQLPVCSFERDTIRTGDCDNFLVFWERHYSKNIMLKYCLCDLLTGSRQSKAKEFWHHSRPPPSPHAMSVGSGGGSRTV